MKTHIVATLRLEIVKPLDGAWDDLGRCLRALRAPLHRVLNSVVRELELGPLSGATWEPTAKGASKGEAHCSPQTASYRIAGTAWERERFEAAARVAKGKPYSGDDAIATISPTSACVLGVSSAAYARWQKYRKEAWKGTMSLPSFRGGSPIYISGSGVRVRAEDGNAVLSIHLDRWRDVVVKVDGGNAHAALRRILDNPESIGDVRLIEDDDRRAGKRKWFAMLAYTFERPTPAAGRTMAVHRGMRNFLTIATARGERMDAHTEILETGEDIVRHKEGYRARRRSLGRQGRQLGFGAKGHGVDRRMERVTRLEDAEERWVQSKCREVAANLVRRGLRHGVTRVLLEDWSNPAKDGALELSEHIERLVRSFPFAKLRAAVEWAATKQGWTVELVETDYNSRDCPACGHRHDAAQIGTFLCGNCRLERSVDVIFAWNMLRRDAKVPGVEESKAAAKRAVRKLRASAAVS